MIRNRPKPRLIIARVTRYFVILENVHADHPMDRYHYVPKNGPVYRSLSAA